MCILVHMTTAEILDKLNSYTGTDIWQDVIYWLDVDMEETERLDPTYRSDVLALANGQVIRHEQQLGEWVAA